MNDLRGIILGIDAPCFITLRNGYDVTPKSIRSAGRIFWNPSKSRWEAPYSILLIDNLHRIFKSRISYDFTYDLWRRAS